MVFAAGEIIGRRCSILAVSNCLFCFVCRGLQDELFNLTLDQLRVKAERTRAEAKLNGSIQRIQLDNQMLVRHSLPNAAA